MVRPGPVPDPPNWREVEYLLRPEPRYGWLFLVLAAVSGVAWFCTSLYVRKVIQPADASLAKEIMEDVMLGSLVLVMTFLLNAFGVLRRLHERYVAWKATTKNRGE